MPKPDPFLLDDDNPEWTADDFARAKPVPAKVVKGMRALQRRRVKSKPSRITRVSESRPEKPLR